MSSSHCSPFKCGFRFTGVLLTLALTLPCGTLAANLSQHLTSRGESARRLAVGTPSNLALGRPVVLSSVAVLRSGGSTYVGDGFKLVDGDRGTNFFAGAGCAETLSTAHPWARIDMGRSFLLASVSIWSRTDDMRLARGPLDLYVGNEDSFWEDNIPCAENVYLNRTSSASVVECLSQGRYLWLVLQVPGAAASPLSLCEVEITPKGPSGSNYFLQTIGTMWDLELSGIALQDHDRIRIVADTVLCGGEGSSRMDSAVLALTAPLGQRAAGDASSELWRNIQIQRKGFYKVCWCGNANGCHADADYSIYAATLNMNGVITSGVGITVPGALSVQVPFDPVLAPFAQLVDPYSIAVDSTRLYFSERVGHRVRYLDLQSGVVTTLCGDGTANIGLDGVQAQTSQLWSPQGLGLTPDGSRLYIAESGSHRVRMVQVSGQRPEEGIIETFAGSPGNDGCSGDGGDPLLAVLKSPSCVHVDLNSFVYICDTGNNRVRIVSPHPTLIPGTNQFRSNVILSAAGDTRDCGSGPSIMTVSIDSPVSVTTSSGIISQDVGQAPAVLYISESGSNLVRKVNLFYFSFEGEVSILAGTGLQGSDLVEGEAGAAQQASFASPSAVAVDTVGTVYVADTLNNRVVMVPDLQYMSIGCWRENPLLPLIPSIEPEGADHPYLDGNPETRLDAVRKCALATLTLNNKAFAVRQRGYCATSSQAHLEYGAEGETQSCDGGLGSARDNSVYQFTRTGQMVERLGLVFALIGRQGTAGSFGDGQSGWDAELNRPVGVAVDPTTQDLWIADAGNNRLQLLLHQVGPDAHHTASCVLGFRCTIQVMGNGMFPGSSMAIIPLEQVCGDPQATFRDGFGTNPTPDHSSSLRLKEFDFGVPRLPRTGEFRLCFCAPGSLVFGTVVTCSSPQDFIHDAGRISITGPDTEVATLARVGMEFAIPLYGQLLSDLDRIALVPRDQPCGEPGAATMASSILDTSVLSGPRTLGNTSFSLWKGIVVTEAVPLHVCWCQGSAGLLASIYYYDSVALFYAPERWGADGFPNFARQEPQIRRTDYTLNYTASTGAWPGTTVSDHFAVQWLGKLQLLSPGSYTFWLTCTDGCRFKVAGATLTVLAAQGGESTTSMSLDSGLHEVVIEFFEQTGDAGLVLEYSGPDSRMVRKVIPERAWLRTSEDGGACTQDVDFRIHAGDVAVEGPWYYETSMLMSSAMDLVVQGTALTAGDRIRIIDASSQCGAPGSSQFSAALDPAGVLPATAPQRVTGSSATWEGVRFRSRTAQRVCWCGRTAGCRTDADFLVNVALLTPLGPQTVPRNTVVVNINEAFAITIPGNSFQGSERIRVVDRYTTCGQSQASNTNVEALQYRAWVMGSCLNAQNLVPSGSFVADIPASMPFDTTPSVELQDWCMRLCLNYSSVADGVTGCELRADGCWAHREALVGVNSEPGPSCALKSLDTIAGAPTSFTSVSLTWSNVAISRTGVYKVCYCSCPNGGVDCCATDAEFFLEVSAVYVNSTLDAYVPDALFPPIFPEERDQTQTPVYWGVVPRDEPRLVNVTVATLPRPASGLYDPSSAGPIMLHLVGDDGQLFPYQVILRNLEAGAVQNFFAGSRLLLGTPRRPSGIQITSETEDAWYCDYIEVTIEGLGTNIFSCEGGAVTPTGRLARIISDGYFLPPYQWSEVPSRQVALWSKRIFAVDICGGCALGFRCVQERVPAIVRMEREVLRRLTPNLRIAEFQAVCKPICGDGYAALGEQCDDGNLRSHDGCSGSCQVEHGFECVNYGASPSKCYLKMCEHQATQGMSSAFTTAAWSQPETLGYVCQAGVPVGALPATSSGFHLCHSWMPELCPANFESSQLTSFAFTSMQAEIDCKAARMESLGFGLTCNGVTLGVGISGFESPAECSQACLQTAGCTLSIYSVYTGQCHLLPTCNDVVPCVSCFLPEDYHVSRKVAVPDFPSRQVCTQISNPKPVWAHEEDGIVVVQMDSPTSLLPGMAPGMDFSCRLYLSEASFVAVGGEASVCRWIQQDVLEIVLGAAATLGQSEDSEQVGELHGQASVLDFLGSQFLPVGADVNTSAIRHVLDDSSSSLVELFVGKDTPLAVDTGGAPQVPHIEIQGPQEIGGCSPLHLIASTSSNSGGRSWRSVAWRCLETRPDPQLPLAQQEARYGSCVAIQAMLDAKQWCEGAHNDAEILHPCELQVILPSSAWCGLASIRLAVELVSSTGYVSTADWRASIRAHARIPIARAVGPQEVTVPAQVFEGGEPTRLRLEIATDNDAMALEQCNCQFSAIPGANASEGGVAVQWLFGERSQNSTAPKLWEMTIVQSDESNLPNLLILPVNPGNILIPGSSWFVVARAAYASIQEAEAALVTFIVNIGPLLPPEAVIQAPPQVSSSCAFALSATGSRLRTEPMQSVAAGNISFQWDCSRLAFGVDGPAVSFRDLNLAWCDTDAAEFLIPSGVLRVGLYMFTVLIRDHSLPPHVGHGSATVTVEVVDSIMPAFHPAGPAAHVGPSDSVAAQFTRMGYGTQCPQTTHHRVLLLRTARGLPPSSMRPVTDVPVTGATVSISSQASTQLTTESAALMPMLEPGFLYAYQLVMSGADQEAALISYVNQLLLAGQDTTGMHRNIVAIRQPPAGVWVQTTEPFDVLMPPTVGNLLVTSPPQGIGYAMQDAFLFEQVWATDFPPLEHSYYFGQIPPELQHLASSTEDLTALVPGGLVSLSAWTRDPLLMTVFPAGMYVVEARARDANGLESRLALTVTAVPIYVPETNVAQIKLQQLEAYVARSRQAIKQMKASNRGASASVPVNAAVRELYSDEDEPPLLAQYDLHTMIEWNESSGIPNPMTTQEIYGIPIISRALRFSILDYMHELVEALTDIISFLEADSLQNPTTTPEEAPAEGGRRRLTSMEELSLSHSQGIALSCNLLAVSLVLLRDEALYVELAELILHFIGSLRRAHATLAISSVADVLGALSMLSSQMAPAQKERDGEIRIDVDANLQGRLAKRLARAAAELSDAISGDMLPEREVLVQPYVPCWDMMAGCGDAFVPQLQLSVVVRELGHVQQTGFVVHRDFHSENRWASPRLWIDGLGPSGWDGSRIANWDSESEQNYVDSGCFGEDEHFLDRIALTMVSWTRSPALYATGSLINLDVETVLPYTLQLRSCGQAINLNPDDCDPLSDSSCNRVQLEFRLATEIVRERRWGYPDFDPYQASWWQDEQSEGAGNILRWSTKGCLTEWDRGSESSLRVRCGRLPGTTGGSIMAVEVLPRPAYILEPALALNSSVHNIVSYVAVVTFFICIYLWMVAREQDQFFWPDHKTLRAILFVPLEHRWKHAPQRLEFRGRASSIARFQYQLRLKWETCLASIRALRGEVLFFSVEVQELSCMRSGKRDAVYENFFEDTDGALRADDLPNALPSLEKAHTMYSGYASSKDQSQDGPLRQLRTQETLLSKIGDSHKSDSRGPSKQALVDAANAALAAELEGIRSGEIGELEQQPAGEEEALLSERQEDPQAMLEEAGGEDALAEANGEGLLPDGWEELVSEQDGGRPYYANMLTGETTWEKPFLAADGSLQFRLQMWSAQQREAVSYLPPGARQMHGKLGTLRVHRPPGLQDREEKVRGGQQRISAPLHRAEPPEMSGLSQDSVEADWCMEVAPAAKLMYDAVFAAANPFATEPAATDAEGIREQVEHNLQLALATNDIVLPANWALRRSAAGAEFYVNIREGLSQWEAPKLPVQWQEQYTDAGDVYYVNLFDGSTQWHWPAEKMAKPYTAVGNELALPGAIDANMSLVPLPTSPSAAAREQTALVLAAAAAKLAAAPQRETVELEQVDATKLLAMEATDPNGISTPKGQESMPLVPHMVPWGANRAHDDWDEIRIRLKQQKYAQESRFEAARHIPGLRDFLRPHEMDTQVNNWARRLEMVDQKFDVQNRGGMLLGQRAELRKEELRAIFPVVQRLRWTKWPTSKIFTFAFLRGQPTYQIYINAARPTKAQRCLLHFFTLSTMLLVCLFLLLSEAPDSEEVTASGRAVWTLIVDVFTMGSQLEVLWVAASAVTVADLLAWVCRQIFFSFKVNLGREPPQYAEARNIQMKFWHDLARLGSAVCWLAVIIFVGASLGLCAVSPQPRATSVLRAFLVAVMWHELVAPLLKGAFTTLVLAVSRRSSTFDGVLSAFPSIMNFVHVGINDPETLGLRLERICKEDDLLRKVHREPPTIGGITNHQARVAAGHVTSQESAWATPY